MPVSIDITIECETLAVDESRLRTAVQRIVADEGVVDGRVGIAILSDAAVRELNKRHLAHDYETDVISFVLNRDKDCLEGEIAISAETARREAGHYGWAAEDELLLYVVHGALHLVGCDDTTDEGAIQMRRREREVLGTFGLVPPWDDDTSVSVRDELQEGSAP